MSHMELIKIRKQRKKELQEMKEKKMKEIQKKVQYMVQSKLTHFPSVPSLPFLFCFLSKRASSPPRSLLQTSNLSSSRNNSFLQVS